MLTTNDHALFFHEEKMVKLDGEASFIIPLDQIYSGENLTFLDDDYFFLKEFEGKKLFAISILPSLIENNKKVSFVTVREALATKDRQTAQTISRGKQLLHWHRSSLFCGSCGAQTRLRHTETAKICQDCQKVIFPPTHPVILVLIEDGNRLLLGRSPNFTPGMYSTLAGFVDAGETCEEAVHREIAEEVGVKVMDVTYFGSQSWPFPSSVILGYTAKYKEGEICIDKLEIEDARWFDIHNLPILPSEISIARQMIDHYVRAYSPR